MKKSLSMMLAGLMLVGTLAGCGGGSDSGEQSDANAFKIGGTSPLTGDAAIYGNAVKRGAEIAAEEINAKGGVQIELKFEDDENNTEKAVNAYNTLKGLGHAAVSGFGYLQALRGDLDRPQRGSYLCADPVCFLCGDHRGQGQRIPDVLC